MKMKGRMIIDIHFPSRGGPESNGVVAKMAMTHFSGLYLLRAQMSLALKTPPGSEFGDFERPYGAGFNAEIEIGWNWTESLNLDRLSSTFSELVQKIDHRHLGMDAPELQITTPESLLKYCLNFLNQKQCPAKVVRFRRGEDIVYELSL
jgi:hypothetical protein